MKFAGTGGYVDFDGIAHGGTGTRVSTKLDAYEEGTWTPHLMDSSGSTDEGATYSTQTGNYTRIGNRVFFNLRIVATSLGTLTTSSSARISMPFDGGDSGPSAFMTADFSGGGVTAGQSVQAYIAQGGTELRLQLTDVSTGVSAMLLSEFSDDGSITVSGQYAI